MSSTALETLLPFRRVVDGARARLLCFPFVGASAMIYREWPQLLGPSIDVCAIELPGHGTRMREPLFGDMDRSIAYLLDALRPLFDKPVVVFGHSVGARVGYALALREPRIAGLIASAAPAAHLPPQRLRVHLSRSALVEELRAMGGTPRAILEDELLDCFLPAIRAGFGLNERGLAARDRRVSCPLTALAARDDREVLFESAASWMERTSGEFRLVEMTGGHFNLQTQRDAILAEVRDSIDRWC